MRNDNTVVLMQESNQVKLSYTIASGTYPPSMYVEQDFLLKKREFTLKTKHTNEGDQEAPVNFGEHLYWDAPNGWKGLTINGVDVTEIIKADGIVPLEKTNKIEIPGMPVTTLEQEGFACANLWIDENPATSILDTHYVCIEPVERNPEIDSFGAPESMIAPGESRTTRITIKV